MFTNLKILVTGCSGFLGPWLCERLLDMDATVVGADINFDKNSRVHELTDRMDVVDMNIESLDAVDKTIREREIDFVFHLAAQALVGVALEKPLETINTNVMGTANILEVQRKLAGTKRALKGVLVASSDKAYGDQDELPYLEDAPMMGRFPYDVSKSCADLIARSYFYSYGLPICVTRCGNLYGGGDLNYSRIVPGTIKSLLEGKAPIIRSDGTLVRDYIYIEDAAHAVAAVGEAMLRDDTVYGAGFNISNDSPMSVIEIVNAIREVMGKSDLEPVIENTARGEIKAQFLSSAFLRKKLGWQPKIGLQDGLARTAKWYQSHMLEQSEQTKSK